MTLKILVTGACGGIGSVLIPRLLEEGHNVTAVDNLYSGDWSNIKKSENLETITIDITSNDFDLLPWEQYTNVIHLAAISSLPECQSNPTRAFEVNFIGTVKTAINSKKSDVLQSFVNASTSAIYEANLSTPFFENNPVSPHLVYSQSKLFAENFLEAQKKDHSFPAISFRFFNFFGPMQNYARKSPPLLNYLVNQVAENKRPVLHSDGNQSRDYIDVYDICEAIVSTLSLNILNSTSIFNLSSGQALTVNEIVELVSESLNVKIDPIFRNSDKLWDSYPELSTGRYALNDEVVVAETNKKSVGDSSAFTKISGWRPATDQRELLKLRASEALTFIKSNKYKNER